LVAHGTGCGALTGVGGRLLPPSLQPGVVADWPLRLRMDGQLAPSFLGFFAVDFAFSVSGFDVGTPFGFGRCGGETGSPAEQAAGQTRFLSEPACLA
jgi:hypothetical protein